MNNPVASNKDGIDPVQCEKEPIHIPGSIQPFGILLAVDRPRLVIRNASVNTGSAWGIAATELVGRSFAELVQADQIGVLENYLVQDNLQEQLPLVLSLRLHAGRPASQWELSAHEHAGCLILELEASTELNADPLAFHRASRDAIQALQVTGSLQQLCDAAVVQMQAMTGFDRVMLYRFTEDWHGVVVAEACGAGMDSYLGHHFPASDIPAQARAVFLQNWLRMIPDVEYVPAALHPGLNPLNGAPLDLGKSTLRSVSPIHLEYLRNMQVGATLTVSLIDEGRLWGLIACHHPVPRRIDTDSRLGAKMIGQLFSSQIQVKQSLEDLQYRSQLRSVHAKLLEHMEQEEDLVQGLVRFSPNMLDLADASGAAAAVYHDGKWTLIGATPPVEDIERLIDWLADEHAGKNLFHTNCLSHCFPPAAAYKEIASGLLAAAIPKTERNYILWFRPEVATTITWAGNPEKPVRHEGARATLHPRASFASWKQIVSGMARPWKTVELEVINELRNSIISLDLRREFRKEQAARALAERISREKQNVVNMVSHDLRTPLAITKMSFEFLQQFGAEKSATEQRMIEGGLRAAQAMERLTSDILEVAKIDAGTLALDMHEVSVNELLEGAAATLAPLAIRNGIQLEADVMEQGALVSCDRGRIEQVFNNLIGNAIKFTPPGGRIVLTVSLDEHEAIFCVADTGAGIAADHLERIFDRFWQEEHARSQGTGLGLAIVKGIMERHHGRIWAESTAGAGSRFYFSLPRSPQ